MKRCLEFLDVINSMGEVSRLQVFHAFDGGIEWGSVKRFLGWMKHEGLVNTKKGDSPEFPELWFVTDLGRQRLVELHWEEDPTDIGGE